MNINKESLLIENSHPFNVLSPTLVIFLVFIFKSLNNIFNSPNNSSDLLPKPKPIFLFTVTHPSVSKNPAKNEAFICESEFSIILGTCKLPFFFPIGSSNTLFKNINNTFELK